MLVVSHRSVEPPRWPTDVGFQETLNGTFGIRFKIETKERDSLKYEMKTYFARSLRCADIWFSPHTTSLIPGGKSTGHQATFLVTLQTHGEAVVRQSEREARIQAGDLFILDTNVPFEIQTTEVHTRSVYIDSDCLRQTIPEIDRCTAVAVRTGAGNGKVFQSILNELFDLAPNLDEIASDRFAQALPHVLAVALDDYLRCPEAAPSKIETFHRERIRYYVRRNLRDPELSCEKIAHAVNLSTRHVHDLFADETETLMRWVWSERLKRIHQELSNPALRKESVSATAFDWGFSDPAHFSRSFKIAFGVSPSQVRARAT